MRKLLPSLIILVAGCTSSSKNETSTSSDSTVVESAPVPVQGEVADNQTASDTTEKIMLTDVNDPNIGDADVREYSWSYSFYGFSSITPTLAAFEQYGPTTPDNGDKGDLEFYAVDVAKNDYATKPFRLSGVTEDNQTGAEYIRKYNVEHGLTSNHYPIGLKNQEQPELTINGRKFILRLLQRAPMDGIVLLELQLINPSTKEGWVLQSDKSVPKSRGKVLSYWLEEAYTTGNNVAVMVSYNRSELDKDQNEYFLDKYLMVTGSIASKSNFKYEPSKTEVCTLNYIGIGDCAHIEFSCGDFGDADTSMLPQEDKALWQDLSDDDGNLKPQYKGKGFEITYSTTFGETCGDPSDPNPSTTTLLVTGFKMK